MAWPGVYRCIVCVSVAGLSAAGCGGPQVQGPQAEPLPPQTSSAAAGPKSAIPLDQLGPVIFLRPGRAEPAELPAGVADDVAAAELLLAGGDYARAISLGERAAESAPSNARICRALGLAYAGVPDVAKALENLRVAAELSGDDLEVQLILGRLYAARRQNARAILAYRTALKTSAASPAEPMAAEALWRLAGRLGDDGYWTAALEAYALLEGWLARHGRGYVDRAALRDLVYRPERLLTIRGRLLIRLDRPTEAAGMLEWAYELNHTDRAAARFLAEALAASGAFGRAEELLADFAAEPSQSIQLFALIQRVACAQARQGQPAGALRMLARLLTKVPKITYAVPRWVRRIDAIVAQPDLAKEFAAGIERAASPLETASLHFVAAVLAETKGDPLLAAGQYKKSIAAKEDFLPPYDGMIDACLRDRDDRRVDELLASLRLQAGQTAFAYYVSGKVHLARRNVAAALEDLDVAFARNKRHVPTLRLLAEAYTRTGQVDRAVKALLLALSMDSQDVDLYRRLFYLYLDSRKFDLAKAVAIKVIRRHPKGVLGRIMMVELLLATNRQAQAMRLLEDLQIDAPRNIAVKLLTIRGQMRSGGGKLSGEDKESAVRWLVEFLRDKPENAAVVQMLAAVLAGSARPAEAADIWRGLYERTGKNVQIAKTYAVALRRAGRHAVAVDVMEGILSADGEDYVWWMLIDSLGEIGQFDRALELVDDWLEESASSGDATTKPAELVLCAQTTAVGLLCRQRKFPAAMERLERVLADNPRNVELLSIKATILSEQGCDDEAVAILEEAHRLQPDDPSANNHLAYYYAERGVNLDQAERMLRKALADLAGVEWEPSVRQLGRIAFLDSLGWVFYKQGRLTESARVFEAIVEKLASSRAEQPGLEVLWDHAGDVFYRLGRKDRAVELWTRAIIEAGKNKRGDKETRRILTAAPAKIAAHQAGRPPALAPLGKGVAADRPR